MKLVPVQDPQLVERVASWLADPENCKWLDFAGGQRVTPLLVKIMSQRDTHFLRVSLNEDDVPIGVAGLNNIDRNAGTATFWGVTGEKSFRRHGYATLAWSKFLTLAFRELNLHVIDTWVVETNPSRRIVERLGFRHVGRQRECHRMDGRLYSRELYDLLASEHRELSSRDTAREVELPDVASAFNR
jgi:RimJ/RimL family protein N-acetyltransferase